MTISHSKKIDQSQNIVNAVLGSSLASAALICITMVTGVALARALSVDDRGYYGVTLFIAQFGVAFFLLSSNEALTIVIRRGSISNERSVPLVLIGSTFLLAVFLSCLAVAIGLKLVVIESGLSYFQLFSLVTILVFIGFLTNFFISIESADLSFRRLNIDRVLSPLIFLCLVVLLYILKMATLVNLIVAFAFSKIPVLCFRFWRFRHNLFGMFDKNIACTTAKSACQLHIAMGAMTLSSNADRIIAVTMWPAEWLGYYFVAYSAAGVGMSLAAQAIQITLLPHMAGLSINNKCPLFERSFRLSLVAGFAVAIPVWIIAPWVVPFVYGDEYTAAVSFVRGLVLAMAFTPVMFTVNVANRSTGRGRPGVEMAGASLTIFGLGFIITGFSTPNSLFYTMFVSNIVLIVTGLRHLFAEGSVSRSTALIPRLRDIVFLSSIIKNKLPIPR